MKLNLGSGDLFINGKWAGHLDETVVNLIPHESFSGTREEWPDMLIDDILDADVIG